MTNISGAHPHIFFSKKIFSQKNFRTNIFQLDNNPENYGKNVGNWR